MDACRNKAWPASLISDGCVIVIVFNKAFCALLHGSPPRAKDCYSGRKPEGSFFFFSGNHRLRECSHLTFCELLSSHLLNGGNKEKFRELIWGLSGRALISLASFHYWSPKRAEKAARATTVFSENLKRSREVQ